MAETTITITKNESTVKFEQPFIEEPTLMIEVQDSNGMATEKGGDFATPSFIWFKFDMEQKEEELKVVNLTKSEDIWDGFTVSAMSDAIDRNEKNSFDLRVLNEAGEERWLKQPTNWRYTAKGKIA